MWHVDITAHLKRWPHKLKLVRHYARYKSAQSLVGKTSNQEGYPRQIFGYPYIQKKLIKREINKRAANLYSATPFYSNQLFTKKYLFI